MPLPQHFGPPSLYLQIRTPPRPKTRPALPRLDELWFRLDVSQYYVIRTIIILDASVEGHGVLEFPKDDVESPAVPPCKSPCLAKPARGRVTSVVSVPPGTRCREQYAIGLT